MVNWASNFTVYYVIAINVDCNSDKFLFWEIQELSKSSKRLNLLINKLVLKGAPWMRVEDMRSYRIVITGQKDFLDFEAMLTKIREATLEGLLRNPGR